MAAALGKRLPSAAEYDAIVEYAKHQDPSSSESNTPRILEGLFNNVAEWSTTRYKFPGKGDPGSIAQTRLVILKGFEHLAPAPDLTQSLDGEWLASPSSESPQIGWRYVRSGAPRFVTP